ncbi:MAG: hypothetical protein E6J90_11820 [Deltaproteobacteria bacterium]|nr:MAG: hypothetical protein E6J90_11820 [Deltaproteobacteria bacterium]
MTRRTNHARPRAAIAAALAGLCCIAACARDAAEHASASQALGDETGVPDDGQPVRRAGVYRTPKPHGANPVAAPMTTTQAQLASQIMSTGALQAFAGLAQASYTHPGITGAGTGLIETLTGEHATVAESSPVVLAGTTASYRFAVHRARGVLELHHRSRGYLAGNPADIGTASVKAIALGHLAALGITPEAGATVEVRPLERSRVGDPGDVHRLAYKVYAHLTVHGVPVDGPSAILSYYVDGSLHKVVVAWPAIHTDAGVLGAPLTVTAAATAAFSKLTGHPLGSIGTPLTLTPGLVVDGDVLRRALFVRGRLANPGGDDRRGELIVPL